MGDPCSKTGRRIETSQVGRSVQSVALFSRRSEKRDSHFDQCQGAFRQIREGCGAVPLNRLLKNGAFVVKARVSLSKNEEMGDDVLPLHYLVS